ncbi:MAG: DUF502 domain-containing protein [Myxococcota bacterium]
MSKGTATTFKSALLAGVLVLAPLGITFWVFFALVGLADGLIRMLPSAWQPSTYLGFPIPGLGVLVALILVMGTGFFMRYFAGQKVVEWYERLLGRVPLLSGVYQGLKQLTNTVFTQRGQHFRQVVLMEYPRKGLYCFAFVTNEESFMAVEGQTERLISVFLPTTPNPTSGFYLLVPARDLMKVDISSEEAFKLIMSAGIVTPGGQRLANDWIGLTNPNFQAPISSPVEAE